ncbi:TPA: 30S ribosomal protein S5 [Patescibacteria group bacterium]|nr:MAG: 30S ribosomal protein S5 [Parcubacteria group bacterium GW2011_GWA2_46_39]HBV33555.1 30S ribosomal protein S5 [Patescibacteria group bacterium]HCU47808.1 30S ribosomal protein S5 [Patescibacteria group bacterium]
MSPEVSFRRSKRFDRRPDDGLDQKVIDISRVTRVMAGGKRMRFRALVVVGDHQGKVGAGLAKGADVSMAVNKATTKAKKHMIRVPVAKDTIPHQIIAKFGSSRVLLKPAPLGTGIIAGGPIRVVLGVAGIPNVVSKMLGSPNKINNVRAVLKALQSFKVKI